jgi:hypothetical protein
VLYLAVAGSLMFRGNVSKPRPPSTPQGKVPAHAT